MKELRYIVGLVRAIGCFKAFMVFASRLLQVERIITAKVGSNTLFIRPLDSDFAVLSQVFGWKEYEIDAARLAKLRDVAVAWKMEGYQPTIIDAGANAGYSSLYFSNVFPGVKIFAIEPCLKTFEMLCLNVDKHPDIKPIHAALWSHENGLALFEKANESWGNAVHEGRGTPSVRLDSLFQSIPAARALLIKMDIEGAEKEVIASCPGIFSSAKCLLIEPHDFDRPGLSCLAPLYSALAGRDFDTVLSGENLAIFASDLFGSSHPIGR